MEVKNVICTKEIQYMFIKKICKNFKASIYCILTNCMRSWNSGEQYCSIRPLSLIIFFNKIYCTNNAYQQIPPNTNRPSTPINLCTTNLSLTIINNLTLPFLSCTPTWLFSCAFPMGINCCPFISSVIIEINCSIWSLNTQLILPIYFKYHKI